MRYQLPGHLRLLSDRLSQLARGDIRRLMVFMPPRSGKSLLCSQFFPAWFIGAYRKRVILTSYESSLAAMWGRLSRDALTEWGPRIPWRDGPATVSQASSAADHWELEGAAGVRGVMHTAGVGASITGRGADLLAIDDPIKNAEEAGSAVYREKAWQWYLSTAYTRLEPDGRVLVIQTRWHDDDLAGRILRESERPDEWTVLSLPAIAEHDEEYPIAGDAPFTRQEGEALWPDRFGPDRLAAIRSDVGSRVWSALYQQKPLPDGGTVWHREWFGERYSSGLALDYLRQGHEKLRAGLGLTRLVQTIDCANKTGVANDFSVIATWGRTREGKYLLLDVWRARVEFPDLKMAVYDQFAKWHPHAVYVEDAASGQSLLQELQRRPSGGELRAAGRRGVWQPVPVIAWKPLGSKVSRAEAVTPLAKNGLVLLPDEAPWLADWLEEHVRFPVAPHDDQVDTTSMALEILRETPSKAVYGF